MDPDGDVVPYHELLALARDEGLIALDVHVIQAPGEANGRSAVVQATARTREGGFAAVGEAAASSTPPDWHPFLITLAELRAKARALRELTGVEQTVREELAIPYPLADTSAAPDAGSGAHHRVRSPDAAGGRGRAWPDRQAGNGTASAHVPRPTAPSTASYPPGDVAGEPNGTGRETPPHDDVTAPHPTEAPGPPQTVAARDEPDFEGIDKEMEAKLLKLAISIAAMEGTDLSEAEARHKLDDFVMRAFKHPLGRATRIEGQRVVQRLSSELSRLRAAANAAKE
jgi:hypothetical protein